MERLDHLNAVLTVGEGRADRIAAGRDARGSKDPWGQWGTPDHGGVHGERFTPVWDVSWRACTVASPKRDVVVRAGIPSAT
ncbi:hypothetical protein ABZ901_06390 [Actinacidiphila alni]|uniref:hypothetical protein n=1 Tax=Actinacidiphila alni TaxID=380248 RepID=UPI0033C8C14D